MDMPALQYCASIQDDGSALALIPDSKYGYRAEENRFGVTLINTSVNPDPYPERGIHNISIALAVSRDDPKALEETATEFNHAVYFLSDNAHPGVLPVVNSFLRSESNSAVISAVIPTEEKNVFHVRYYEPSGNADRLTLNLDTEPAGAVCMDLNGREIPSDVEICGKKVTVSVGAGCIGELKITL